MSAPVLVHDCGVEREFSTTEWWRGVCSCGWRSSRYAVRGNAADRAAGHRRVVEMDLWYAGGVLA